MTRRGYRFRCWLNTSIASRLAYLLFLAMKKIRSFRLWSIVDFIKWQTKLVRLVVGKPVMNFLHLSIV